MVKRYAQIADGQIVNVIVVADDERGRAYLAAIAAHFELEPEDVALVRRPRPATAPPVADRLAELEARIAALEVAKTTR